MIPSALDELAGSARVALTGALEMSSATPVEIHNVVRSLGLGALVVEPGSSRHGAIQFIEGRWHPVVFRRDQNRSLRLSPRERFTVAHEVAHALLEPFPALQPRRRSEYWALEELCNDFAGRLLVPESHVHELVGTADTGLIQFLQAIFRLADAAGVSTEVVARRTTQTNRALTAAAFEAVVSAKFAATTHRVKWVTGLNQLGWKKGLHLDPTSWPLSWLRERREGGYASTKHEGIEAAAWIPATSRVIVVLRPGSRELTSQASLFPDAY